VRRAVRASKTVRSSSRCGRPHGNSSCPGSCRIPGRRGARKLASAGVHTKRRETAEGDPARRPQRQPDQSVRDTCGNRHACGSDVVFVPDPAVARTTRHRAALTLILVGGDHDRRFAVGTSRSLRRAGARPAGRLDGPRRLDVLRSVPAFWLGLLAVHARVKLGWFPIKAATATDTTPNWSSFSSRGTRFTAKRAAGGGCAGRHQAVRRVLGMRNNMINTLR